MEFKKYQVEDYGALVNFLIEINQDESHLNWNWGRLEWMNGHPEFDRNLINSIGLWINDHKIVGAAIFDMYFGEASILAIKDYHYLYEDIIDYAYNNLRNEDGLAIAVNDNDNELKELLIRKGYKLIEQKEELLTLELDKELDYELKDGFEIVNLDPRKELIKFQKLLWQGFNHELDGEEFMPVEEYDFSLRNHANYDLSLAVKNTNEEYLSYSSLWYLTNTDYAYIEPLCTIPSYRKLGLAKAVLFANLNKARKLGAKRAIVISDNKFYYSLGFKKHSTYRFYRKLDTKIVNDKSYNIIRLLGKGKGGYSFLAELDNVYYVLKQIHHEPCEYYSFGDKIQAELQDYHRLLDAKIRIPKMIDIDRNNERIIKEYIEGDTIFDLVKNDEDVSCYIEQVREMANLAKNAGLNIDYFPTNFVVKDGKIYYIDYECNNYMEQWNFENWGIKYWSKSKEFIDYLNQNNLHK